MKTKSYKRIGAYVLDIIIVTIISWLLTFNLYNNKTYKKQTDDYVLLVNQYANSEISNKEYKEKTNDLVYEMNKETIVITIVNVVMTTVYFVVVPYYLNGATLGKKLMKLKIISNNNKKITMNQYLIRSLFINGIIMNFLGIVFIMFLPKNTYIKINDYVTYIFGAFYIVSFAMILFREDKRGLHDILGNTRVVEINSELEIVSSKEEDEKESKKELIKDAEIIGKELKM